LLLAIPEHKVPLPGGHRASQIDVFALLRVAGQTLSVAIEGKIAEPFGPTLDEWLVDASDGKLSRLAYLRGLLGLPPEIPGDLRYQLLHRAGSAVIEAERFKTDSAAMVVHSFSPERTGFDSYSRFLEILGLDHREGAL
jgi:CubicO group peptidase (beta-lactamase class C family)